VLATAASASRRHLHDLASQHDVALHWVDTWDQAETFAVIREVRIPWVEDGSDYLIALHELGHVIAPGAQAFEATGRSDVFTNLALEGLAWAWAVAVAITELVDPDDWETPIMALWTHYEKELERRGATLPHEATEGPVSESDPNSTSTSPA
jgi:hypothetical protein